MDAQQRMMSILPESFAKIFEFGGVCVAGGFVASQLYNNPKEYSDIDVFIYGCSQDEAFDKLCKIISLVVKDRNYVMVNTPGVITLQLVKKKYSSEENLTVRDFFFSIFLKKFNRSKWYYDCIKR